MHWGNLSLEASCKPLCLQLLAVFLGSRLPGYLSNQAATLTKKMFSKKCVSTLKNSGYFLGTVAVCDIEAGSDFHHIILLLQPPDAGTQVPGPCPVTFTGIPPDLESEGQGSEGRNGHRNRPQI